MNFDEMISRDPEYIRWTQVLVLTQIWMQYPDIISYSSVINSIQDAPSDALHMILNYYDYPTDLKAIILDELQARMQPENMEMMRI